MLGSATIKDGQASISTNLQRGEIAIVKVGSKSVKIKAPLNPLKGEDIPNNTKTMHLEQWSSGAPFI